MKFPSPRSVTAAAMVNMPVFSASRALCRCFRHEHMLLWRAHPRGSGMVSRLPQDSCRPKRFARRASRDVPEDDVVTAAGTRCAESPAGSLEMAGGTSQLRPSREARAHLRERRDHCSQREDVRVLLRRTADRRDRAPDARYLGTRARPLNFSGELRLAAPRRRASPSRA